MENKQTAVEWLIDNLSYIPFDKTLFPQAIKIEKQQIIDAYCADRYPKELSDDDYMTDSVVKSAAEQYYSETYKKPKQ